MEQLVPVLGGLIAFGFFGVLVGEWLWFRTPSGPFLRGLPVWSEPLAEALVQPLSAVPERAELDGCWARREGQRLLVYADFHRWPEGRTLRYRTAWPYVAVVDLDRRKVVFRQPIASTLFVLPHLVVFFPVVALMAVLNHRFQAPSVRAALQALADDAVARAGTP